MSNVRSCFTRTHACIEPVVSSPCADACLDYDFFSKKLHGHISTAGNQPKNFPGPCPQPHDELFLCSSAIMATRFLRACLANKSILGVEEIEVSPDSETRDSMSPSSGDVAQTPESKSTSGLASVFKSLTGSKSSRNPNAQSPASIAQNLNTANTLKNAIYGGPPNYDQLFEQLKVGNPLPDRLAAAESLRHAVQDYPLSGVRIQVGGLLG